MDVVNVLKSSVIAGICIGIAGIGFLATRDIVGSVLFAFALLSVVAYKLYLYTGTAGFIKKGELFYALVSRFLIVIEQYQMVLFDQY